MASLGVRWKSRRPLTESAGWGAAAILFAALWMAIPPSALWADGGDLADPEILYREAVDHLLRMDEEKALSLLAQIPGEGRIGRSREADAYLQAAEIFLRDPEKAHAGLHYLNQALSLVPEKGKSLVPLLKEQGLALSRDKPWLARRLMERAAQLEPNLLQEDRFSYALTIETVADPRSRVQAVESFVLQFPKTPLLPAALYRKGDSHYQLGEFSQAKAVFERIVKEYPESPEGTEAKKRLAAWKEFHQVAVTVPPDPAPVKTGIVLYEGEQVTIGASGFSMEGPFSQGPEGRKEAQGKPAAGLPLPTAPPMALIGKIGEEGPWFLVARGYVGKADRKGELHLMMNRPPAEGKDYKGRYHAMVRLENVLEKR